MNYYRIPVTTDSQRLAITLADIQYNLAINWVDSAGMYYLDIQDTQGNSLASGIPLVDGTDLLVQHRHLFTFGLFVDKSPAYGELGATVNLYGVW